jgi:hypothetical protein
LAVAPLVENAPPVILVTSPTGPARMFQVAEGRLKETAAASGLAGANGEAVAFVDVVENDLKLDLFVAGPDRLFRGGGGSFAPFAASGLPAGTGVRAVLWGDFDHEGDLDLVRLERGPKGGAVRLFQNNADGTFTDVTRASGITASVTDPSDAVFADFDDDGDLDFLVADAKGRCLLFDNQRGGDPMEINKPRPRFAEIGESRGFSEQPRGAVAVATADLHHNGSPDLLLARAGSGGLSVYRNPGDGNFHAGEILTTPWTGFSLADVAVLDYDNDGETDIVAAGSSSGDGGGVRLLRGEQGGMRFADASGILPKLPAVRRIVPADVDVDGAMDLVVLLADGGLRVLRNDGGATNHWLKVVLEGEIKGDSKNNSFGLGATIEVKRGREYQKQTVEGPVTHFGLGPGEQPIDVVRAVWSNGVPQSWLELPAAEGKPAAPLSPNLKLHAKQVLKGSCPFVYAWDGEGYRFVTDCLWRSPLGLRLTPTFTAPHDQSTDWVKIPRELLRPVNGDYFLTITEELWETLYLDYARLVVVDHPADTDVWVDEVFRMGPPATFRLYPVAEKRLPTAAVDDAGRDQLPALRAQDGERVTGFEVTRYQGVARPHDLTLTLGPVPDPKRVLLYLQGWIFPTDTSINMAVSQNRAARVIPPRIDVPDGRGGWRTVAPVGLPAGKNKTVIVDLSGKLAPGDLRVRITTTMEIYWDHIFYTSGPQSVPIRRRDLKPIWSDLHYFGFSALLPRERSEPHLFDHARVDRRPRWRDIEGDYTRYGDVTPLLQAIDDQYVIMNAGDEVTIQFDGRGVSAPPSGWVRDFILITDGWDKDADINTLASQRVEPLPFHGMKQYPPGPGERYPDTPELRRYRREYNTRRVTSEPFRTAVRGQTPR